MLCAGQVDVQDVTEYYYDNEARIELLETRYAKLEEHLRAAEKMEDIIALEQEMSEILSELDALKGTRRHLDHQVEYSTLTIEISEVVRSSGVATSKEGVGSRMARPLTARCGPSACSLKMRPSFGRRIAAAAHAGGHRAGRAALRAGGQKRKAKKAQQPKETEK